MKKINNKKLVGVFFTLFMLGMSLVTINNVSAGSTYYVSTSGSDSNAGTSTAPWRTIAKAMSTASAGDTVLVASGSYGETLTWSKSGTSSAKITIKAQTRVTPGPSTLSSMPQTNVVTMTGSYLVLDGIACTSASGKPGVGIRGNFNTVQYCYTKNTGKSGIEGFAPYHDMLITRNYIDSPVNNDGDQEALSLEGATGGVYNFEISYNTVYSTKKEGIDAKVGCYNGKICYNTVYSQGPDIYIDNYGASSHDIEVFGNYCYGKQDSVRLGFEQSASVMSNIKIYNNIFKSSAQGVSENGDNRQSHGEHIYIYNNVFDGGSGFRIHMNTGYKDVIVRNNIFSCGTIRDTLSGNDITWDHNFESGDPKWVNPSNVPEGYKLQASSPCINAGVTTGLTGGMLYDYWGASRTSTPDQGIHEYGGTVTPVAPTVSTISATSITATGATLNGNLVSMGNTATCNVWFQYGLSTSYGSTTTQQSKTSIGSFSAGISSLTTGTLYHFRACASNSVGTNYGADMTFTPSSGTQLTCDAHGPYTGVINSPVSFSGTASGGTTYSWDWNWGDSTTHGNTQNPTHTYTSTGTKTVTLTVTSGSNTATDTATATISTSGTSLTVSTTVASGTTTTGAILNGNLVNMGGTTTCDVWFQYGKTTSYGSTTSHQTKTSTGSFSATISGLTSGTTYHFRAVASNSVGTVYGSDSQFTTTSGGGSGTTFGNIGIGDQYGEEVENTILFLQASPSGSGTLSKISAYIIGQTTTVKFKTAIYSSSLSKLAQSSEVTVNTDWTGQWVDFPISGISITSGTQYYLAIWAENNADAEVYVKFAENLGSNSGADNDRDYTALGGTFPTTLVKDVSCNPVCPPDEDDLTRQKNYCIYGTYSVSNGFPVVETLPATSVATTTAILNGNLVSSTSCTVRFEYGTTTSYGTTTTAQTKTGGTFLQSIGGLVSGTTYHFRAIATNTVGTSYGLDMKFTVGADSSCINLNEQYYIDIDAKRIECTYIVTNCGQTTLTNIAVMDSKLGAVTLTHTTLAPGETTTGTKNYVIKSTDDSRFTITITATAKDPTGTIINDTDSATLTVRQMGIPGFEMLTLFLGIFVLMIILKRRKIN